MVGNMQKRTTTQVKLIVLTTNYQLLPSASEGGR